MNKEALIELRALLETIPAQALDMDIWFVEDRRGCSTAACALGWAAMHKPFNEQGLRLVHTHSANPVPDYGGWIGYCAAREFFELKESEVHWLFNPGEYALLAECHDQDYCWQVTPQDVIERINSILEGANK